MSQDHSFKLDHTQRQRDLNRRCVAVTGAGGFIGGRIVDYLTQFANCEIRACVRRPNGSAKNAQMTRRGASIHHCDVLNKEDLQKALQGCDAVIHCAYGSEGSDDLRWRTTVDGTRNVVEVAQAANVSRLVHLSTSAIHDTANRETLDEDTPMLTATPGSYEDAKQKAEMIVYESILNAIALRPTVVFGPWGKDWTITPINRLLQGVRKLPEGSDPGICNAVYVEDVAQAAALACATDTTKPIIISSGEATTWGRFYDAFRAHLPISRLSEGSEIEDWERALYADRAVASIERARLVLGYEPRYSFELGMEKVAGWAAQIGILNQSP
jgi:nucleoside-diphosphate-sugar epimerase